MKKFEEIIDDIRDIARKIIPKWGDKFVVDELVNEAWIAGKTSNLPSKYQMGKRARWDMLDYIKKETQIRNKSPLLLFTNIEIIKKDPDHDDLGKCSLLDQPREDENLLKLENKELLTVLLLAGPTERQLELMLVYYFYNKTLKETGKEKGITENRVCTAIKGGLKKCREQLELMEI